MFGVGDQAGYGDNFNDAMDELASCFKKQGASIIGATSTDGYDFTESKSVSGGKFIGEPATANAAPSLVDLSVVTLTASSCRRFG